MADSRPCVSVRLTVSPRLNENCVGRPTERVNAGSESGVAPAAAAVGAYTRQYFPIFAVKEEHGRGVKA